MNSGRTVPDPRAGVLETSSHENPDRRAKVLLDLARGMGRWGADQPAALSRITEAAAEALGVGRVGIWFYDEARSEIRCADLFERASESHGEGATLKREDHPRYFDALDEERILAAEDAERDPRTSEFTEGYLRPNGIGSMLDAPVRHAGEVIGVVCNEHVGPPRTWSPDDRSFAASIADFVGIAVTERQRHQAEASLRQSERQFRLLAENSSDMIVEMDEQGRFLYVSPSHRELLGYAPEELVGTNAFAHMHPDDLENVVRIYREGLSTGSGTALFRYRHRDGSWRWAEGTGRAYRTAEGALHGVVTSRDVTKRIEAEAEARELHGQLSQAQRLEAVGRLAGGIAHDFNNLLTAIMGHLEVASEHPTADETLQLELKEASGAAARAADLTRRLLALGRDQVIDPRVLDVNAAIESLTRMIRRVIGEDVELHVDLDPELPPVRIDATQLDQVLMNLVINCRDAMPEGGTLEVRTRREHLAPGSPRERLGGVSGPHVRIEVRDTGVGMDAATAARVFDPFFTTKPEGKGSGLGLTTVYQILREARGGIELESEAGRGTAVSLRLPAAEESEREPAAAKLRSQPLDSVEGTERILVVEDEAAVRRLIERALVSQGYEVLAAGDGREALAALEGVGGRVDLAVSDVVMPVMGGVELARQLAERHPHVKILLLSGYAPPSIAGLDVVSPDRILQKPFTTRRLLERVREILESTD